MESPDKLVLDHPSDIFAGQDLWITPNIFAKLNESASRLIASADAVLAESVNGMFLGKVAYLDASAFAHFSEQKSVLTDQINELKEQAQYRIQLSNPTPQSITLVDDGVPSLFPPCVMGATGNVPLGCWPCCSASVSQSRIGTDRADPVSQFFSYLEAGEDFAAALAFLWNAELAEEISKAEKLLSSVIAAIAIFLRHMRTATVVPFAIAVSQRQFFTHHGAHPPTERSLGGSGLFVGKGFQPAAT